MTLFSFADRYPYQVVFILHDKKGKVVRAGLRSWGLDIFSVDREIRLLQSKNPRWVDLNAKGPKYYGNNVPGVSIHYIDPRI